MKKNQIILICIFLLIISSFLIKNKKQIFIESFIKDNILYISKTIEKPFRIVINKIDKLKTNERIYNEYIKLKEKEKSYINLDNSLKLYKNEIDKLNNLLDISDNSNYETINSRIINRNIGDWFDYIIIDKGFESGIKIDDCVINNEGFVGKVVNITNNTSDIKLLTNFNNKISVIVNSDKEYYGLLYNYNEKDNTFNLEGISSNNKIEKGNYVITSGLGSYRKGLLIGYVDEIINDSYDLSVILKVKPYVNFNDIDYVAIIK